MYVHILVARDSLTDVSAYWIYDHETDIRYTDETKSKLRMPLARRVIVFRYLHSNSFVCHQLLQLCHGRKLWRGRPSLQKSLFIRTSEDGTRKDGFYVCCHIPEELGHQGPWVHQTRICVRSVYSGETFSRRAVEDTTEVAKPAYSIRRRTSLNSLVCGKISAGSGEAPFYRLKGA